MSRALLCIAGGGTGGHVMPAMALADAVRRRWPDLSVRFIGAERGLEAKLLPARGEAHLLVAMHAVQGATLLQKLRVLLLELPRAIRAIRRHWRATGKPALVVGVGGYASVAAVLAAVREKIPVVLYEQNAIPGLVNRTLARLAERTMVGFAEAANYLPAGKSVATGNVVPEAVRGVQWRRHNPPRLLVTGGSQGAMFLNETVPAACQRLAARGHRFEVTHISGRGEGRIAALADIYGAGGIEAELLEFCNDMPGFYGKGDLLIARAGAMTVGEVATVGLPSLLVPLPHAADNHQWHNAAALQNAGGARIVEQATTSAEALAELIEELLFDEERLATMSRAAMAAAPRAAADKQLEVLARWLAEKEQA